MNKDHPLLEQIRQIEEQSKTGFLSVTHNQEVILIYFQNGLMDAASSSLEEHRLGRHFVNEGLVDPSRLSRLLKRSKQTKSALGEAAVQLGIISSADLRQLIARQAFELVGRCLEDSFQIRSFAEAAPAHNLSAQMHLDALLLELARSYSKPLEVAPDQRFRLREEKVFSSFPWSPQEITMLIQLRHSQTLGTLLRETNIEEATLRQILDVFQHLDLIDISNGGISEVPAATGQTPAILESLIPEIRRSGCGTKLEILKDEPSFASEQFRSLKTCIREIQAQRAVQVIGVTSARMQDGKSLVSSNLALTLARDPGRRIILVDCDFRNPSVQRYFDISVDPGVIGCLQESDLQPYCHMRRLGRLFIMTAGGIADNPVELLSHSRMRKLVDDLRTEFDTIVLDSPPLEPISDARIIAGLADGMLMVIRRGKTPYRSVEKSLKQLDRKKLLGVVFNDVKALKFNTYHDYHYYGNKNVYSYGRPNSSLHPSKPRGPGNNFKLQPIAGKQRGDIR